MKPRIGVWGTEIRCPGPDHPGRIRKEEPPPYQLQGRIVRKRRGQATTKEEWSEAQDWSVREMKTQRSPLDHSRRMKEEERPTHQLPDWIIQGGGGNDRWRRERSEQAKVRQQQGGRVGGSPRLECPRIEDKKSWTGSSGPDQEGGATNPPARGLDLPGKGGQ